MTAHLAGKPLNLSMLEVVHLFDLPQAEIEPHFVFGDNGLVDPVVDLSRQLGPKYCAATQLLLDVLLDPENDLMLDCGQRFRDLIQNEKKYCT